MQQMICWCLICQGNWKEMDLNSILPTEVVQEIMGIPLPRGIKPDRIVWAPDPTGKFTIKSAYSNLTNSTQTMSPNWPWNSLWKLKLSQESNSFLDDNLGQIAYNFFALQERYD